MPVFIIGWSIYDTLPKDEQKELALVAQYQTYYFYECYEYEYTKGNKNHKCSVIDVLRIRRNYWNS